jgi:hypothetical protein
MIRLPYNRCRPEDGIRLQIRMEEGGAVVPLIEITPGGPGEMRATEAWLEIVGQDSTSGGVLPCFVDRGSPRHSIEVSRRDAALLGVERDALREALGRGDDPVIVSGFIARTSTKDPESRTLLRIELSVENADPPRPRAALKIDERAVGKRLNLADLQPAVDGYIAVARIEIAPEGPQRRNIPAVVDVRFVVDARLRWGDDEVRASLRPRRLRHDEAQWRDADERFSDRLVFDAEAGQFAVYAIDIGVPHAQLRKWLGRRGGEPGGRMLHVDAAIWFRRDDDGKDAFPTWQQRESLELVGELRETLIFSGICEPFSVSLADVRPGNTYERILPKAWIVKADDGALRPKGSSQPRQLLVLHEGGAAGLSLRASVVLCADGEPVMTAPPAPVEALLQQRSCNVPVDLASLLKRARHLDEDKLTCVTMLEVHRGDEPARVFLLTIPLKVERSSAHWLACIDFGASCTAIWIGKGGDDHAGMFLPLGDWLSDINPLHDESGFDELAPTLPATQSRRAPRILLPSHIGLSSDLNLRTGWDPLSLGDLSLSLPTAAGERLKYLKHSYDISAPFPSREKMAEHLDTIITQPKKRMIERDDVVRLRAPVFYRAPESDKAVKIQDVALGDVIEECFDELGGYVAVSALHRMLAGGAADDTADQLARERIESTKRFAAVVTHPSGIEQSRKQIYHRAGLRFVTAFAGPAAPAPDDSDVTLVPEAMAAARYGIQKFIDAEARGAAFGNGLEQTFITLDIGAGTYDVTVIDATVTASGVKDWKVQSHFGLALGGADLDEALNSAVKDILRAAAAMPQFQKSYAIEPGFPLDPSDSLGVTAAGRAAGLQLRTALQIGKARLSQQLLERRRSSEPYVWRSRSDGGEPLQVRVGRQGDVETWPLRRLNDETSLDMLAEELPGANFRLVCEKAADGIRLDIWPEALQDHSNRLADLVTFMGTALPELAFEEHLSRRGPRPARPPVWIVTGRTALWPPLFDAIRRFVEGTRNAGTLLLNCPFAPEQMKQAVVNGAFDLARTPWLLEDNTPPNPLAIIEYRTGWGDRRQLETIRPIGDAEKFEIRGPFAVARVIPSLTKSDGLDWRRDLIQRVGIAPWVDLTGEIFHNEPGRWSMACRRDAASIHLTLQSPSGKRLTLGPFQEGRVYGP